MQEREPRRIDVERDNPFDDLTEEQQGMVEEAVLDTLPGWEINKDPLQLSILSIVHAVSPSLDALLEAFGIEEKLGISCAEVGGMSSDQVIIAVKAEQENFRLDRMAVVSLAEKRVVALG